MAKNAKTHAVNRQCFKSKFVLELALALVGVGLFQIEEVASVLPTNPGKCETISNETKTCLMSIEQHSIETLVNEEEMNKSDDHHNRN